MEIKDLSRRGSAIDSSITLLFNEADDLIFYKYIKNFEEVFAEIARKIIEIEEKKFGPEKIAKEIVKFQKIIANILHELHENEVSAQEITAFPAVVDEESKLQRIRKKLIVCGDPEVGKTSIILKYTDNAFRRTYIPTMGVNLSEKQIRYKDADIKFIIWDIAGQTKFKRMRSHFYKGADGLLLVFDLTARETFENIPIWYKDIQTYLKGDLRGFILGNKKDLADQRKVNDEEIEKLAKELHLDYYETSALTGKNIYESFSKLAKLLYGKKKKAPSKKKTRAKKRTTKKKKAGSSKKLQKMT